VRYDELAPLLLQEVQQQERRNEDQATQILEMKAQLEDLRTRNDVMQAALEKIIANSQRLVSR
jgi:hypothetical protein